MTCPFCHNSSATATAFPLIKFNGNHFHYVRCKDCDLVYLNHFPSPQDYELMYPPSYQGTTINSDILPDPYQKVAGLHFSYGEQFDLIRKLVGANARILDYGCGNGHFLANAIAHKFYCDGTEFSEDYLKELKLGFPKSSFFTVQQALDAAVSERYDVIRLSNVLEHLTTPDKVIQRLKTLLSPGGIFLVEGPIEDNFSLAESFRKSYFRIGKWLKPARQIPAPPYHIFFSNSHNQRKFFSDCGLEETYYKTKEEAWPFPESFSEARGLVGKLTFSVAKVSIGFTKLSKRNWGNTFIYCGRISR